MAVKIPCFEGGNLPELKAKFDNLYKDGMSETEQKELGKKIALDYHKELHGEVNKIRTQINKEGPSTPLNVTKYKPEDLNQIAQETKNSFDEKIRETKADNPEPPEAPPKNPPGLPTDIPADASGSNGTAISKQAIFDKYGVQFEKTKVGWNDVAQNAVSALADEAIRKGTSVDLEAESQVKTMLQEIKDGKLVVNENRIVTAALNLMNLDEKIDNLNAQVADSQNEKAGRALSLDAAMNDRMLTMKVIDALGTKSGRNLGLFAGIFSKNADGGISAYRNIISGVLGVDLPETIAALDANTKLSNADKDKIRPYVEKLEQIKKDYDAAIKKAKEAPSASPKSSAAKSQKSADKLRGFANKIKDNKEWWDKNGLGSGLPGVKRQGLSVDIHELVVKAINGIADAIDKGSDMASAIKEAVKNFRGENDEKDFEGVLNHVLKQNESVYDKEQFAFGPNPIEPIDVKKDAADAAAEFQRMRTIGQLKALAEQAKANNEKWYETATDFRRNFLIGGLKTLARVGESGVSKFIVDPIANLTTGNIASLVPGLEGQRKSVKAVGAGIESIAKFKSPEAALAFADQKQEAFDQASKALEADPGNKDLQTAYMKAELENGKAAIYRYINDNAWTDSKELAKHGSTDFEEAMGGYSKIDPTVLRGSQKALYFLGSLARLHGVEKNPSARRSLVESYNNKLLNYQKQGIPLSASTRMRALNMAYEDGFLPGKYQNKTQLSELTNRIKYLGDEINKNKIEKSGMAQAWSTFMKLALPVAKVPINIVKTGVDLSTLGIEGIFRYQHEMGKQMKLNEEQGKEYGSIYEKLTDAAKDIPEKQKAYIHNLLSKGLFGMALYAYAAYGVSNGTIRYGGSYEENRTKRKYKGSDGEWHDDLDYGQWVIAGQKFGKFGSSVLNHLPEFLPIALAVNTHNVYQYEHEYEGASGNRELKSKTKSFFTAVQSDINEVTEKLPFGNVTHPSDVLTGITSIPIAKDISEYFDKDANGNLIERKPDNVLQKMEGNAGLRFMVDKKVAKDDK